MMRRHLLMSLLLMAPLASACGGDASPTDPGPSATTSFQGTVAGSGGQSGTLSVTVQAQVAAIRPSYFQLPIVATVHAQATTAAATGSLRLIGSGTTALTGTYDSSNKTVNLSGGGFTFAGSASGAVMTGTYTGSSGVAGAFSTRSTTSGTVTVYCGNAFGAPPDTSVVTGVFNLVVSDASGAVSGAFNIFADTPPTFGSISGQLTGTALSATGTATGGRFAGQTITLTGTIQGGSVNGTTASSNPFSGSVSRCQS
jgi:hypothetical protein